jgi:transcriptional regulator with XRE-family HTH domain
MIRLRVKEVAQAKGISQRKLFFRSEVDLRTIQKIYKNPYTNITIETLAKLAKGLGVSSCELIEDVEDN